MKQTSSPVRSSRLLTGLLAAVAVLMSTLVGAMPAQAVTYSITFAPKNGTVGVTMALTSSVSSDAAGVGEGIVTYYASGKQIATASVDTVGSVAAASWVPNAAGEVPMYAAYVSKDGTQTATSVVTNVTFAQVATKTTLTVPSTAKVSSAVELVAEVKPTDGSYVPTGPVVFQMSNGAVLASANLDSKGVAKLTVQMPAASSTYSVKAVYNGDSNAKASTSGTESILVTTSGSVIDLVVSGSPYAVGKAMTLTATITPANSKGSVSFTAGSTVIGAVTVSSGKATLSWKPTASGSVTLTATFTPSGTTKALGSDSEKITVSANLASNTITLGPSGQAAWKNGQFVALRYQSSVILAARSASGGTVSLAINGPCALTGSTLKANAGTGTCTLTATSPATSSYAAGKQVNTIVLARGRQTATLIAPQTRSKLKRYRTYLLANPGTKTNIGNTVTWKVTYGKKRCRVFTTTDGTVYLRTMRTKLCKVRAYAPPVTGQWLRFKKVYRYKLRR